MHRRLVMTSAIAGLLAAAFLPGSGLGSSAVRSGGAREIPAGLAAAIHAQLGLGRIRLADSPAEQPELGFAAALSADGTTALVSAPGAHNQNGAVYVYHVASAGSWASSSTPAATLAGAKFDLLGFGIALSADGTTAFVAAPFGAEGSGAVYVYHVSSEEAWASTAEPTATLTNGSDLFFAASVGASADGTTLVAGDPFDQGGGAVVFHVPSEDAWASSSTPTASLTNAAEPGSDEDVGWAVAMAGDGTTALVSDNRASAQAGAAYVFHVASEAAWTSSSAPTAVLSNASGVAHDWLGYALGLSADGTTAFLGVPHVHKNRGAVDVFHVADAGAWASSSTPAAILTNGGGAANDYLGDDALAVSPDGATVVVGDSSVHRSTGAAYVYHVSGEGAWTSSSAPTAALTDSHGRRNDLLGASVATAADGATVLSGAPGVNWWTGKTDVFHVANAGSWLATSTPTAKLTNSALPKPLCVVPNLLHERLSDVKLDLDISNCVLGKVKRIHSTKKNRGRVVWQSPAPRRHLRPGSKVDLKVGK